MATGKAALILFSRFSISSSHLSVALALALALAAGSVESTKMYTAWSLVWTLGRLAAEVSVDRITTGLRTTLFSLLNPIPIPVWNFFATVLLLIGTPNLTVDLSDTTEPPAIGSV